MIGNPFVGSARIGWMEFRTHLKSPRLIILAVLFALLVFGASYGMSQTQNPFQNQIQAFAHPAIANESGVVHYLVIGWLADYLGTPQKGVTISLYSQNFTNPTPSGPPPLILVGQAATNESGFVSFDVGTVMPMDLSFFIQVPSDLQGVRVETSFFDGLVNQTFTLGLGEYGYSGPFGSKTVEYVHMMTLEGAPATAADIYLNDTLIGHPNQYGYFSTELPPGESTLKMSYNGYEQSFHVYGSATAGAVYENGADVVLLGMTFTFLPMILPIVAIAVSFDAIARERVQGSLELLLCRRVRREGILAGKFLGTFASAAIPVVGVLLGGIAVVTVVSGRAPTASFAAVVIGASLFLLAVYVLLMLLFSTLAKSVGTAVVFGVVVWLFFNLLFSFITVFLLFAMMSPTTPEFYGTLLVVLLFDPNLVYQILVTTAAPSGGGGSFGLVPTGYLSTASLIAAVALWIVIPLLLTILVFRRKAES